MNDVRVLGVAVIAVLALCHVVLTVRTVRANQRKTRAAHEVVVEPDMLHNGMEARLTLVLLAHVLAFLVIWFVPEILWGPYDLYWATWPDDKLLMLVVAVLLLDTRWVLFDCRLSGPRRNRHRRAMDRR